MNLVILDGYVRKIKMEKTFISFTIAVKNPFKKGKKYISILCAVSDKYAGNYCRNYLIENAKVRIVGQINSYTHNNKDYTGILVSHIQIFGTPSHAKEDFIWEDINDETDGKKVPF